MNDLVNLVPPSELGLDLVAKHIIQKRKRSIRSYRKTSVLRQPIDSCHVDNIKFPLKSLSKHTENRERRKNSDKSSPPQPSLFHLCLPKPPPHHTPKLTATEVAGAVRGAWKHTGAAVSHDPKVCFS
nr:hypothetical protein CFP56_66431 [Quercus suber]